MNYADMRHARMRRANEWVTATARHDASGAPPQAHRRSPRPCLRARPRPRRRAAPPGRAAGRLAGNLPSRFVSEYLGISRYISEYLGFLPKKTRRRISLSRPRGGRGGGGAGRLPPLRCLPVRLSRRARRAVPVRAMQMPCRLPTSGANGSLSIAMRIGRQGEMPYARAGTGKYSRAGRAGARFPILRNHRGTNFPTSPCPPPRLFLFPQSPGAHSVRLATRFARGASAPSGPLRDPVRAEGGRWPHRLALPLRPWGRRGPG